MSSPTINLIQSYGDTSLLAICNLVRSIINDTQAGLTSSPGEGQIFTDNNAVSPFVQPLLNSAIREVYRELRNVGAPTLVKDNVIITGLPPIDSPTYGLGQPDPAVQTYLGFSGYFDGVQIWPNILLPNDVIQPDFVWERQTGTTNPFIICTQPEGGLPSRAQQPQFGQWEWRNDNINFVGALQTNDIRIRYWCQLPRFFSATLDFASTYVPIIDCPDAVAYKTAYKYATALGSPGAAGLKEDAKEQMFQLKQQYVRRQQTRQYTAQGYHLDGMFPGQANSGYVLGWQ
jgi:hypothetical protein